MDGQDGQHVEVRWAKLGPRGKSGWEPLKPSGSPSNIHALSKAPVGHVLSSCYRAKIGR
jgi:hypothetical protein